MHRRRGLIIKRIFDLIVASLALLALSPIIALVAGIVYLTMGRPVLFKQLRLGLHGRGYTLLKFRTMTNVTDRTGVLLSDAQRLTPVGKFLRASTLDELPGLVNVLRGEMSLVGPRPLLVDYRDLYTPEQWRRHEMRPGMAGPVLAAGRNALSWDEKFAWDVWYVDHWSFVLDLRILLRTVSTLLRREGINPPGAVTMPRFEGSRHRGDRS